MTTKAETLLREALEKIAGQREYDPKDHREAAKYKPDDGSWTTDEYLADTALAALAPSVEGQAGGELDRDVIDPTDKAFVKDQAHRDRIEKPSTTVSPQDRGESTDEFWAGEVSAAQTRIFGLKDAMREAIDLLSERTQGSPARSAGHNARLRLEQSLAGEDATPPAPDRAADPDQRCLDDMRLASNVRAAVIEECAKVAEEYADEYSTRIRNEYLSGLTDAAGDISGRIRALGSVSGNDRASEGGK